MMKGDHGQTNQLHDINWGALDHASIANQLFNYYLCVCVCVCSLEDSFRMYILSKPAQALAAVEIRQNCCKIFMHIVCKA